MPSQKVFAQTVFPWLRANCGKHCTAGLTGQDCRALRAAVHIVELWSEVRRPEIARAFAAVVAQLQPKFHYLAYHAIAHPTDWGFRAELWAASGLPPLGNIPAAKFGPGGAGGWQ